VFVEASGFAASVTLRTTGNKQTVQISSKGEIRGVNITMSKAANAAPPSVHLRP
jgi:hypothetical protein